MSDFVVTESWINTGCGDSVHHVVRCLFRITRYNISDSTEGYFGGQCGDFWTPKADSLVSFANLVDNTGYSCFVTFFEGILYSERLNMANNTDVHYFLDTCADYTEFSACCLFRATSHPDRGTCAMIDCFTNFKHEGATMTETTIQPFFFSPHCPLGRSDLYTKQGYSTVPSVLGIIVLHIGISYAQ